jgi:hypothetical protein
MAVAWPKRPGRGSLRGLKRGTLGGMNKGRGSQVSGSVLSLRSTDSVLSIGCRGSVLSIASVGFVLSIGSIGSALSILSIGSFLSAGSVLSAVAVLSVLSWRTRRRILRSGC